MTSAFDSAPPRRTRMQNGNRFKLGLFGMNCSGSVPTTAPERWNAGWPENREAARLADAAGIEFLLPIARWLGYGGLTDRQGTSFETLALGLGAACGNAGHRRFRHRSRAAGQSGLCRQILRDGGPCRPRTFRAQCRVGLERRRIRRCSAPSFSIMTIAIAYTEEWVSIVKTHLVGNEAVRFQRQVFPAETCRRQAEALGRLAALADERRLVTRRARLRARHVDCLFMVITDDAKLADEIAAMRAGRPGLGVFASGHLMCRATAKETKEYYHYLVHEKGDWEAAEAIIRKRHRRRQPLAAAGAAATP